MSTVLTFGARCELRFLAGSVPQKSRLKVFRNCVFCRWAHMSPGKPPSRYLLAVMGRECPQQHRGVT